MCIYISVSQKTCQTKGREMSEETQKEFFDLALKQSLVSRGLRQAVKALQRDSARVCFVDAALDNENYHTLVKTLCKEKAVPLFAVKDKFVLGELARVARKTKAGKVKKFLPCSVAVVKCWPEGNVLLENKLKELVV